MKNISTLAILVSIVWTVIACDKGPSNFENGDPGDGSLLKVSSNAKVETTGRKLIKHGSISFETEDLRLTRKFISTIVQRHRGYVSDETTNRYQDRNQLSITLRVPAEKFDTVLSEIEAHATSLDNKNVNSKDVTEEFIDVDARLKTKKELELRYLVLLKDAKNVQEVIAVESQLGNVRSEIESMEGRLKYLSDQVALSTLSIECFEVVGTSFSFFSGIFSALRNGWENLLKFVIGLLSIWPFLIIGGVSFYFLLKVKRKKVTPAESKSPL
jgi:hypothetical protein